MIIIIMRLFKAKSFLLLLSFIAIFNSCMGSKNKYPLCPLIKEIPSNSYQSNCQSIMIFYNQIKVIVDRDGKYPDLDNIYKPIVKDFNEKGYNAAAGGMIDNYKLIADAKIKILCSDPNEDKAYLKTKTDYTNFFKELVKRYPQAGEYDLIIFCQVDYKTSIRGPGSCDFEVQIFDNRIEDQILEIKHKEYVLCDIHEPPPGYRFTVYPEVKVNEGIYPCVLRGFEKIFSIYSPVKDRKILNTQPNYPEAYIYRYETINKYTKEKIRIDTKPEYYKYFRQQ